MTAIDRMPDTWWTAYGHDVDCGVPGDACVLLRHIVEEEAEIALLVSEERMVAW